MADLIDREALLWEYKTNNKYSANAASLAQCIHDAPTFDAVEVVRCIDCKNWDRHIGIFDSPNGYCYIHEETVNGYDYCSYGERKTYG